MKRSQQIQKVATSTIFMGIVVSFFLAAIKFVAGWQGNSFALIADAMESATDVFASLAVYWGVKFAHRPSDENHPFGHGKVEPLITFVVVFILCGTSLMIATQAISRLLSPEVLMPHPLTLFVLLFVILGKELFYRYVQYKNRSMNSSALEADAWHHRSDAITSLAAFIGVATALIGGRGYEKADSLAALFAAVVILVNAYKIFRPALGELLDEQTHDEFISHLKASALEVSGVENTEKCYVRKFGVTFFVDIHVRVDKNLTVEQGHEIAHRLKDYLREQYPQVADVFTHIEPTL